ncbi:MAG: formimidoylglutamase [Anaerolineae bacterium]
MSQLDLFDQTLRPDPSLFFSRGDPNDVRLGQTVQSDPACYAAARVVVLGCPQDEGVRRNGGRVGAALAPTEIRRALYRLATDGLAALSLFDLGDTPILPSLEATHDRHEAVVRRLLDDGKVVVSLGGGNDLAYPDAAALSRAASGDVLALNVDTHYDVRADTPRNSGTPYRQLLDAGLLDGARFVELGQQPFANSPVYRQYLADQGVTCWSLRDLRAAGLASVVQGLLAERAASAVFWGLDMDVVRVADAPGVSAPNPVGMTGDEFCLIAELAGAEGRTRLVELTEVNPAYDVDGRTARLAAIAVYHFFAAFAASL